MAKEFTMGARLILEDDFSNPMRDALRATEAFRSAVDGADSGISGFERELQELRSTQQEANRAMQQSVQHIDNMADEMRGLGNDANRAENEIDQMNNAAKESGGIFSGMRGTIAGVAAALGGMAAVNAFKDFTVGAIEAAAGAQATSAQFDSVFAGMEDQAASALSKVADTTMMAEGRIKGSFLQMAAFAKTTGMDTATSLSLAERATLAAADSAAFYDRSIEDTAESLQSFLKGNYENDAALGISATETTRNAAAMREFGKTFNKLSEDQKQFTLLSMVEQGNKLTGAMGQAAKEGDAYENVMGNLRQSFEDFKIAVGGPLLQPFIAGANAATKAIRNFDTDALIAKIERGKDVVSGLYNIIMSMIYDTGEVGDILENLGVPPGIADNVETLANLLRDGLAAGADLAAGAFDGFKAGLVFVGNNMGTILPIAAGLLTALTAFKVITTVVTAFNAAKVALLGYKGAIMASTIVTKGFNAAIRANPIMAIVTGIGLAVAAGILLYQNWDTIKAQAIAIWGAITNFFSLTWQNLKLGWTTFTTEISALWQSFMGWIGSVVSSGMSFISGIWQAAWSFLQTPVMFVVDFISMYVSNFFAIVQGLFTAGMQLIQGDWQGAWTTIQGIGETILNNTLAFFQQFDLFNAGADIINGLIDGIKSKITGAIDAVKEVAGGIKDAVTGFFKIHSPSRLFRDDVGRMLGAGLEIGIYDSVKGVTDAAKSLAEAGNIHMAPNYATEQYQQATTGSGVNYEAGVNIPAAGNMPQSAGSKTVVIQKLFDKIEMHAAEGADLEALVQQVINMLYERLKAADEILNS